MRVSSQRWLFGMTRVSLHLCRTLFFQPKLGLRFVETHRGSCLSCGYEEPVWFCSHISDSHLNKSFIPSSPHSFPSAGLSIIFHSRPYHKSRHFHRHCLKLSPCLCPMVMVKHIILLSGPHCMLEKYTPKSLVPFSEVKNPKLINVCVVFSVSWHGNDGIPQ